MTGQGRGWIIRVGVNRRITEGDIFFSLIGPIFSDRITLLKMKRRALFPREFVARSIGRSCARGGPRTPTQSPSKWSCTRCTRCSPATRAEGSRFIQLLGIKGRGVASRWRIIVSPLSGRRGKERIMGKGKGKGSDISGTEIFRGIEKIFRSNERITSWNKLEQQVEKVEEGRSLCMGRELDRKNCSSPVSLFMHRRTRTHTHTRAHSYMHTYVHTVPSYESLSLPVCITFFLCVFLLHRRIAGRLSCRYNIPRKNFQFPLHKDTLGVSLSFLVSLSARMRSPPWRGGGGDQ